MTTALAAVQVCSARLLFPSRPELAQHTLFQQSIGEWMWRDAPLGEVEQPGPSEASCAAVPAAPLAADSTVPDPGTSIHQGPEHYLEPSGGGAAETSQTVALEGPLCAGVFPETLDAAHARYEATIVSVAKQFAGQTVVLVSHGEAVRAALRLVCPWLEVYEVAHCAHVCLKTVGGTICRGMGSGQLQCSGIMWLDG